MTVLVTGYEPYGGHAPNPSATLASVLDDTVVADHEVIGTTLPVDFERVGPAAAGGDPSVVAPLVAEHDPDLVVGTGLDPDTHAVDLVAEARNRVAADTPDNAGRRPDGRPVVPGAPDRRAADLATGDGLAAALDAGVPARRVPDAGTHVCNQLLYTLLHLRSEGVHTAVVGFVHLPPTPALAAEETSVGAALGGDVPASLPVRRQVAGVRAVVRAALSFDGGGQT